MSWACNFMVGNFFGTHMNIKIAQYRMAHVAFHALIPCSQFLTVGASSMPHARAILRFIWMAALCSQTVEVLTLS
jgi:hypothetical protein